MRQAKIDEIFEYITAYHKMLVETGKVNFFTVGNVIRDRYDLSRNEAQEIISEWIEKYDDAPIPEDELEETIQEVVEDNPPYIDIDYKGVSIRVMGSPITTELVTDLAKLLTKHLGKVSDNE